VETLGVGRGVERDRAFGNPGRPVIIADAAHAKHQRVVGHVPLREDLGAVLVDDAAQLQFVPCAVEPVHHALAKTEVVPVRHQHVIDVVDVGVHAPRSNFVQQRLPKMGC